MLILYYLKRNRRCRTKTYVRVAVRTTTARGGRGQYLPFDSEPYGHSNRGRFKTSTFSRNVKSACASEVQNVFVDRTNRRIITATHRRWRYNVHVIP